MVQPEQEILLGRWHALHPCHNLDRLTGHLGGIFGNIKHEVNQTLPDLSVRERVALWPAAVAALGMGVAPLLWLNAIDPAVQAVLAPIAELASKVVGQ